MRIIITDDEQVIRDSLYEFLTQEGHDCRTAESGPETVELIPRMDPDVVITDFNMPEMNGIELLQIIKRQFPKTHVIVLTGYADVENAIDAVNNGAYAFFRKPLNVRELLETLGQIKADLKGEKREKELRMLWTREYIQLRGAYSSLQREMKRIQEEVKNESK